jgi:hypothetical protein
VCHVKERVRRYSQQGTELRLFLVSLNFEKEKRQYECFPALNDFLIETESSLEETIYGSTVQHLNDLLQAFQKYFPSSTHDPAWVRNPYCVSEKPGGMSVQTYECLIDITSDTSLKQKFSELSLVEFWCSSLLQEYPQVSKRAVLKLLPFPTTYLREAGLSIYAATESKYRYRLNFAPDMRIQLSEITPNFKGICETKKQHHFSR